MDMGMKKEDYYCYYTFRSNIR